MNDVESCKIQSGNCAGIILKAGANAVVVVFLSFLCISCQTKLPQEVFSGKLVVKAACSNYAVEIISKNVNKAAAQRIWFDSTSRITYHNVFQISNGCEFSQAFNVGDTFQFSILPLKEDTCIKCLIGVNMPKIKIPVKVIQK